MRKKLAIVTSHPIQYNAPLFKLLAARGTVEIRVFYTWSQAQQAVFDPGFGRQREWDIPLLEGYDFCFVENTAKKPGSHHFKGIKNPDLVAQIEAWNPDAVLIFGWSFQSHLQCMRYFKGNRPVFFRGDSTLLDKTGWIKRQVRRLFLTWVYRHVDMAFFTGQHNRAYFKAYGLNDNQLVLAPHAVDNLRFETGSNEERSKEFRASLDIESGDFLVLFAGKMEPKKNPFYLIRLAAAMQNRKVKFLLVGNGPLEEDLKKAAKSDERISFLPFQNQSVMPAVYGAANCFLLPSTGPGETWGLAANEAMACGLPVILSSNVGAAPDLVGDRGTGLVFSGNEVDRVAAYICFLQENREEYQAISEKARQHIRGYSFEKVAHSIEEQMMKLAAN